MTPDAEIRKLAHQLGVPPSRLQFLAAVPVEDLARLRRQIGEVLFEANKQHFARVVAASKLVPSGLAAKITERALPPLVAARTAELLDPPRAVDMVARLSDDYLADVAAAMDPHRAPAVVEGIPADRVAAVGSELARRREWVVMGSFVSVVSPDALRATCRVLDGEALLRTGYVLDDLTRLDRIADELSDEQVDGILAAAADHALWAELDEVLANLGPAQARRLGARYAAAPADVAAAVTAARESGALRPDILSRLGTS
jgi:hypothetical protein